MISFYKTVENLQKFISNILIICPWKKLWSKNVKINSIQDNIVSLFKAVIRCFFEKNEYQNE
jgi:hypothetical protein